MLAVCDCVCPCRFLWTAHTCVQSNRAFAALFGICHSYGCGVCVCVLCCVYRCLACAYVCNHSLGLACTCTTRVRLCVTVVGCAHCTDPQARVHLSCQHGKVADDIFRNGRVLRRPHAPSRCARGTAEASAPCHCRPRHRATECVPTPRRLGALCAACFAAGASTVCGIGMMSC